MFTQGELEGQEQMILVVEVLVQQESPHLVIYLMEGQAVILVRKVPLEVEVVAVRVHLFKKIIIQ